ncbi:hypothetical protein [Actinomadura sp. 21ATH]|uniref:hypothetical protein n=1 Tax=Actinomadura sp. 21ATH TaxID=1735444 RepID=UPI0035C254CA
MTRMIRAAADALVSAAVPTASAAAACNPRYNVVCGRVGSCGTASQVKSIYYLKASCDEILVRRCCVAICTGDPHSCCC